MISLKVALLKSNFSPNDALEFQDGVFIENMPNDTIVFYKDITQPSHVDDYFVSISPKLAIRKEYSNKKILIFKQVVIDSKERWIVIANSDSRSIIGKSFLEQKAGIKVVLNKIISQNQEIRIKSVDQVDQASGKKKQIEIIKTSNSLSQFETDQILSDVKNMHIVANLNNSSSLVGLGNWITINHNGTIDEINWIYEMFIENYGTTLYRERFSILDNKKIVESLEIIDSLQESLLGELLASSEKIYFTWPNWLEHNFSHFEFKKPHARIATIENIQILDHQLLIDINKLGMTTDDILKSKICSYDQDGNMIDNKDFHECLFYETKIGEKTYILQDGEWNEIDSGLVSKVNGFAERIDEFLYKSSIEIPAWDNRNDKDEDAYNKSLADSLKGDVLDKKLVYFINSDRLEIGDVLIQKEGTIFAVKHLKNSSNISHLAFQAMNSKNALLNDISIINKKFQDENINFDFSNVNKIVLLIAHHGSTEFADFPFFSRVALQTLFERNNNDKIKFELKIVDYIEN